MEIDANRADRLAVDRDRRGNIGELLAWQFRPRRGATQELRLATDARHDDRLTGLDNLSGDAFADAISYPLASGDRSRSRFEVDVAGILVQQHHRASNRPVVTAENFKDALQRLF